MKNQIIIIFSLIFIFGCSKEKSKTTGWNYNDPKHGGFEISTNYTEQVTPDGMAFIEGGSLLWVVLNKMLFMIGIIYLKQ